MKRLYVLRHAKSLTDHDSINDHIRPISERGRENAFQTGEWMKQEKLIPDVVLCSTALRARMTLERVQTAIGATLNTVYTDKLYLASPGEMFSQAAGVDDRCSSAMLVGHNPGMHQFCLLLTGKGEAKTRKQLDLKFPTCALAIFDLDMPSWTVIEPGVGTLKHFIMPKMADVD